LEVWLRCNSGHIHRYSRSQDLVVTCQSKGCSNTINSSHVFRGYHPYIIWTDENYNDRYKKTFTAIPCTSKDTLAGLPTVFPINESSRNGLEKKSYALIHQVCTVDAACFKDQDDRWMPRLGTLDKKDLEMVEERLIYHLGLFDGSQNLLSNYVRENSSVELLKQLFDCLPDEQKNEALEYFINNHG
jgi:mRNA interferase MazF